MPGPARSACGGGPGLPCATVVDHKGLSAVLSSDLGGGRSVALLLALGQCVPLLDRCSCFFFARLSLAGFRIWGWLRGGHQCGPDFPSFPKEREVTHDLEVVYREGHESGARVSGTPTSAYLNKVSTHPWAILAFAGVLSRRLRFSTTAFLLLLNPSREGNMSESWVHRGGPGLPGSELREFPGGGPKGHLSQLRLLLVLWGGEPARSPVPVGPPPRGLL